MKYQKMFSFKDPGVSVSIVVAFVGVFQAPILLVLASIGMYQCYCHYEFVPALISIAFLFCLSVPLLSYCMFSAYLELLFLFSKAAVSDCGIHLHNRLTSEILIPWSQVQSVEKTTFCFTRGVLLPVIRVKLCGATEIDRQDNLLKHMVRFILRRKVLLFSANDYWTELFHSRLTH